MAAAGLLVVMAQMINEGLYPYPLELDLKDKEAVSEWMLELNNNAFIIIAVSHGLAAFSCGLISSLVADRYRFMMGTIAVCIVIIIVTLYLFNYYFPVWFMVLDATITVVLGAAGILVGGVRNVQ